MEVDVILTKKEINNLKGILDINCDNVDCSICPFNDKNPNCGLIVIKERIAIALSNYRESGISVNK